MNDISIRKAALSDFPQICRLAEQADQHHVDLLPGVFQLPKSPVRSRDRIAQFVESEDADIILATSGDAIVAYICIQKATYPEYPMFKRHDYAQIVEMVVDISHRQRGIGSLLIDTAQQWTREHRLRFMETNVWWANQSARAFYTKCGFQTITQRMEIVVDETEGT
jgi:ribosomal protein S18 acetylase RimI-like enzyme